MDLKKIVMQISDHSEMPSDIMREISEICGLNTAKQLLLHFAGTHIYVPFVTKPDSVEPFIKRTIEENRNLTKAELIRLIISDTRMGEASVRSRIKTMIEKGLLTGEDKAKLEAKSKRSRRRSNCFIK